MNGTSDYSGKQTMVIGLLGIVQGYSLGELSLKFYPDHVCKLLEKKHAKCCLGNVIIEHFSGGFLTNMSLCKFFS